MHTQAISVGPASKRSSVGRAAIYFCLADFGGEYFENLSHASISSDYFTRKDEVICDVMNHLPNQNLRDYYHCL